MKQRKSPVALITVAVFAGIGLMIAAKPFSEERLTNEEKMKLAQERAMNEQRAKMASNPIPTPDSKSEGSELEQAMKSSVEAGGEKGKDGGPRGRQEGSLPEQPVVIKPEDQVYKPVPNSSATSSQWYDKK